MTATDRQLIKRVTAEGMARAWQTATECIDKAFQQIDTANKALASAFGVRGEYIHVEYIHLRDYPEDLKKELKKRLWGKVIDLMNLPSFLSTRRLEELRRQVEHDTLPDLTTENILAFCANVYNSLKDLFNEMVQEVFDWLCPAKMHQWAEERKYKTNRQFKIGHKVIKSNVVTVETWGAVHLSYYQKDKLQVLDNVFHLLDGRGVPKYPHTAVTAIEEAIKSGKWRAETEYFHFEWFKKGTLHIEFKRQDLVDKINKLASDGTIGAGESVAGEDRKLKRRRK